MTYPLTRIIFSLCFAALFLAANIDVSHAGPSSVDKTASDIYSKEEIIDRIANEAVSSGKAAGIQVAFFSEGGEVFSKAYGKSNIEHDVSMATDSVIRIGSVTKQFTAAGILLLAEDGKLALEDKISKYFIGFPRGEEVSIRQLLNHTSGIRNFTDDNAMPAEVFRAGASTNDMVKLIEALGYSFDPGTFYEYTNSGYYLAGVIIEKASGRAYRDFVHERLLIPAGMSSTAVDVNEEIVPHRTQGYVRDSSGHYRNADYDHMSVPFSAGAIRSTAADLLKWNRALHGGWVLAAKSYKEMITPSRRPIFKRRDMQSQYALGLKMHPKFGRAAIYHDGVISGFRAELYFFPESGESAVMLTNTGGFSLGDDFPRIVVGDK